MGRRGPPPTPTRVLRMRGSWRGNRNPREPAPQGTAPRRPKWLDPDAAAAWTNLAPLLAGMGLLASADANALARYCTLWARWRKAEEFLRQHGETHLVKGGDGGVRGLAPYPQVRIAAMLAEQLLRLEQHFGMTPSARSRIETPSHGEAEAEDKRGYLRLG